MPSISWSVLFQVPWLYRPPIFVCYWCRAGSSTVQKVAANGGGFAVKKQPQQANAAAPKQKPQTLDSLFANMKEQRMRVLSQQTNGTRRNGGGQPRVPWARNRVPN